ncbi:Flp pilus assembly CpaF family ATPase [Microbacterium sp. SORGH_AS428]|uniref:ATPase, T2SS/T4P/T4SS family n=1 Tax=Microbacterium sp. SORGH_AS_0428 TaxID=3041788 RepID=UPI00286335D2|nr:ATPase, T2SS/T4P/T4SS family [Microbacterium sp. SORGH_AS_0428]MDR6201244.1 Flp pilus assembly CpaF family ATPase [Microbacterium sp. SORGH_AS_0428]
MSPSSGLRDAMPAEATLAERVRARLRADGVDPTRDPEAGERLARAEVRRHNDAALARGAATLDDEDASVRGVIATVAGYGPLQPFLYDPEVEEVWINAPDRVFVAREGRSERTSVVLTEAQVRELVERMLHATGRRVDLSQPFVDASLPDGSRLHVVVR